MMDDDRVDLGELDDDFVMPNQVKLKPLGTITCRRCGFPGLHWQEHEEGWRLFNDKNILHSCMNTFRPIKEEITNFLLNRLECRKMVLPSMLLAKYYSKFPNGIGSDAGIIQAIQTLDEFISNGIGEGNG